MNSFISEPLPTDHKAPSLSLDALAPGEQAKIILISSAPLCLALSKMGISKGNIIQLTEVAPLGDPIAIRANGTKISLRKKDASNIWIARV